MNTSIGYPQELTDIYKLPCTKERNDKIIDLYLEHQLMFPDRLGGVALGNYSWCGKPYSKPPGGSFNHDSPVNIIVGNNEHA